ncbi:hypothetical protein [Atlantibacter subterraneus]|uniref:hypothetical protein n=1 Tax=Atlantibacter subterraneus TaxID=255519 RepID=UPI0022EB1A91|nr:hypothetical protein [Atlantibacter subterranea]MDA3131712.1 hypothetical protein [Atlantibacter subterranea]
MNIEKLKELKSAAAIWQDDYDPDDDAEQYVFFGDLVQAVDELIGLKSQSGGNKS